MPPTVLSYTNAFPGIPFPNHLSGQSTPQNYRYPGAVQPLSTLPTVLSYTNAFPGIPFPNHLSGQSHPQNYIFPGAVQPKLPAAISWGFDLQSDALKRQRRQSTQSVVDLARFQVWRNAGWEVASVQSPHLRQEKRAGTMRGDDGTASSFRIFRPLAFPAQDAPWPHRWYKSPDVGDTGIEAPFSQFFPIGYDPPQTWTRYFPRIAAVVPKEDGIEAPFQRFFSFGFPAQDWMPPHRQYKSPEFGDPGNQRPLIQFFSLGWPFDPFQTYHRRFSSPDAGDAGILVRPTFIPSVWGHAFVEPGIAHFGRERAAAWMKGDDGAEAPFVFVPQVFTMWDVQPQPPLRAWRRVGMVGDDGIEAPFVPPAAPPWGWDAPSFAAAARLFRGGGVPAEFPALIFPLVSAAEWSLDFSELIRPGRRTGFPEVEPGFWPGPAVAAWGYDHQELLGVRARRMSQPAADEPFVPGLSLLRWGFELAPAAFRGRGRGLPPGIEFVALPRPLGWAFDPGLPLLHRPSRAGLDRGYELVTSFPPRLAFGWPIEQPEPPHPRPGRGVAFARGEDGIETGFIVPQFAGWSPLVFWPPHPRPERGAGFMQGDLSGAWGIFTLRFPSAARAKDKAASLAVPYDILATRRRR